MKIEFISDISFAVKEEFIILFDLNIIDEYINFCSILSRDYSILFVGIREFRISKD